MNEANSIGLRNNVLPIKFGTAFHENFYTRLNYSDVGIGVNSGVYTKEKV